MSLERKHQSSLREKGDILFGDASSLGCADASESPEMCGII